MELLGPFFLIFAVAVGLIVLYVVLRIGAAILRTAVSMTNGFLGTRELKDRDFHVPGGYGTGLAPRPKSLAGLEIPMPDVFQAILINFVSGLVGGVTQTVVLFAGVALAGQLVPPETGTLPSLVALLVAFPAGLLAQVWVLARMLPTTFGRACVVMACEFLIMLLIVAVLLGGAFAAGFMTAAGGGGVGDSTKMLGH